MAMNLVVVWRLVSALAATFAAAILVGIVMFLLLLLLPLLLPLGLLLRQSLDVARCLRALMPGVAGSVAEVTDYCCRGL